MTVAVEESGHGDVRSGAYAAHLADDGRFWTLFVSLIETSATRRVEKSGIVSCRFPTVGHAEAFGRKLVGFWVGGGYVPIIARELP
jgi:hypothetical protein